MRAPYVQVVFAKDDSPTFYNPGDCKQPVAADGYGHALTDGEIVIVRPLVISRTGEFSTVQSA